jgi:hypothetical protein
VETRALTLEGHSDEGNHEWAPQSDAHDHAGGSIAAYPDEETAQRELNNCQRSAGASGALFCLQVNNALVILGGDIPPAQFERVRRAALALLG